MNKSRDLTLTGSLSATVYLTITEKNNSVRNRTISMQTKSYPDGVEKRLIRFVEPADVRGTSMLIFDNKSLADEMWIYLPALKKTRRIVSSEKGKNFMSSEFSNADMSSPTLSDFKNRHLQKSGEDNLWIIESVPADDDKADEYGYSKKISFISADNYIVKKMEFYDFDNKLFKEIEIKNVQPGTDGRYLVSNMTSRNISNGRSSELKFGNIKMDAVIDDSVFTLQNLEK
jgi:outer membrane lipoprotein-sorting protein